MDFAIPQDLEDYYAELEAFIENTIEPMVAKDDNIRFFDHRREDARTDWERGGLPSHDWEALLRECRKAADAAGHWRFSAPKKYGGRDGSNLWMAVIRDRFAQRGLGLHNDLQNEHSIVGNFPFVAMFETFGTEEQKQEFINGRLRGYAPRRLRPDRARSRIGRDLDGNHARSAKRATGSMAGASTARRCGLPACMSPRIARCSRAPAGRMAMPAGSPVSLSQIPPRARDRGMDVDLQHAHRSPAAVGEQCLGARRGNSGCRGRGLALAQSFVHQNRIRQAASSLGAAQYCIEQSVEYARTRKPFGEELARNQAIQFPLVELATQCEMLRLLIYKTAWDMDNMPHEEIEKTISDKVSMCNYWANRLVCEAADRAMQVHGGIGYSRHKPFEHIYRHHRRYRITEGAEEIQMRKVGAYLFGYLGPRRGKFTRS